MNRLLNAVLLLLAAAACADPGPSWDVANPPLMILVGDFDGSLGLEGLHWDSSPAGTPSVLQGLSFADFQSIGDIPDEFIPAISTVQFMELDNTPGGEVLVVEHDPSGTSTRVGAYDFTGLAWQRKWLVDDTFNRQALDLQVVNMDRLPGGLTILATGSYALLHSAATGDVLWDSSDVSAGPGDNALLIGVTVADFDGASNGNEVLLEFFDGQSVEHTLWLLDEQPVASATPVRATRISMGPGRPNPASDRSSIRFEMPQAGKARLAVMDARGRRVRTLLDRTVAAGPHVVAWDGTDDAGRSVSQGVYFFELTAGTERRTRKMLMVR